MLFGYIQKQISLALIDYNKSYKFLKFLQRSKGKYNFDTTAVERSGAPDSLR